MPHRIRVFVLLLLASWAGAVQAAGPAVAEAPVPKGSSSPQRFEFPQAGITFAADFPCARLNQCVEAKRGEYRLLICPETTPINNSPWFAFQVCSTRPQKVRLVLAYQGGTHRYAPKLSRDGKSWTRPPDGTYRYDRNEKQAVLQLELGPEPVWVAAQEMVTGQDLAQWGERLAAQPFVTKGLLGQSAGGRPIPMLKIGAKAAREHVVVIGRQHPPEITGSLGLMAFVEVVAGDSALAGRFRERFQTTVVPLMNPDGVELGQWRCNLNKLDLNRDWGKFTQPETRAARDEIERLRSAGGTLRLLLDFHSTGQDVFYTQRDDQPTVPANFTRLWLGALHERLPDYKIHRDAGHLPGAPTSKGWAYETYRIPAITYELGDNTDRTLIRTVAQAAAEEMMRLLLAGGR